MKPAVFIELMKAKAVPTLQLTCSAAGRPSRELLFCDQEGIAIIMQELSAKVALTDTPKQVAMRCGGATITVASCVNGDTSRYSLYLGIPESLNREVAIISSGGQLFYADAAFYAYLRSIFK